MMILGEFLRNFGEIGSLLGTSYVIAFSLCLLVRPPNGLGLKLKIRDEKGTFSNFCFGWPFKPWAVRFSFIK